MAERGLCFKHELCAEMALVLDGKSYLLGCQISLLSKKEKAAALELVLIGACPVAYRQLALSTHTAFVSFSPDSSAIIRPPQRRDSFLRDVTFLHMPTVSVN